MLKERIVVDRDNNVNEGSKKRMKKRKEKEKLAHKTYY
jgi:hypothetical protein